MDELTPTLVEPVEAPTPSAPPVPQSDDEFFEKALATQPAEAPVEAKDEEEIPAAKVETKPVQTEEAKTEEDEEEFREPEPDDLKRTFKAHPELKEVYYREKAFTEVMGTVKEARDYKEMFPSVDDAKMALDQAQTLLNIDHAYATNPADLLTRLSAGNPNAFKNIVEQMRPVLYAVNPQLYREQIAEPVFRDVLENFRERANEEVDQELMGAIDLIRERLGWDRPSQRRAQAGPQDPRIAEFERMKQQMAANQQQNLYAFGAQADKAVYDSVKEEVDAAFSKLPQDGIPAGVRQVVSGQIVNEVMRMLDSNQYMTRIYNAQKFNGDISEQNMIRIVEARFNQAKPHIGRRVAAMMNRLTKETVAKNQNDLKAAQVAAGRKEAGVGSTLTTNTPLKKVNYSKMSDMDILNS